MKKNKGKNNPKKDPMLKRHAHVPRVYRIVPAKTLEEIQTIDGKKTIVKSKNCGLCRLIKPLGNFYAKAFNSRKGKTPEELTAKDMEWACISCWDVYKPNQRKEKRNRSTLEKFLTE